MADPHLPPEISILSVSVFLLSFSFINIPLAKSISLFSLSLSQISDDNNFIRCYVSHDNADLKDLIHAACA